MKDIAPCNQEDTILYTAMQHFRLDHLGRFFCGKMADRDCLFHITHVHMSIFISNTKPDPMVEFDPM
jgi:hypothetical protein